MGKYGANYGANYDVVNTIDNPKLPLGSIKAESTLNLTASADTALNLGTVKSGEF